VKIRALFMRTTTVLSLEADVTRTESTQQMTGPGTEIGIGIGIGIEIPTGTPVVEDTEIAPTATETPLSVPLRIYLFVYIIGH
jgi:hypothetical protein